MYFGATSTASVALRPRRTSAVSLPIVSFKPLSSFVVLTITTLP